MRAGDLSDLLFWIATIAYVLAMGLYFAHMAWERRRLPVAAWLLGAGGAGVHLVALVARSLEAGRVPWGNMFEYSSVLAFLLVAGYLIFERRRGSLAPAGAIAMAIAVVTMFLARALYTPPGPLVPALNSWWLKVHVISAILASSIFSLGFVFTVLYLLKERSERKALFGGSTVGAAYAGSGTRLVEGLPSDHVDEEAGTSPSGPSRGFLSRLPAASTLDAISYRMVAVAFPIWTWAVIAGAIWASKAWGRYWGWDPKETWAFITWVIYAGYLHARATAGWRGRRAAVIAAAGFVSLWVTYYVVNLWVVGLHSYAGVQ